MAYETLINDAPINAVTLTSQIYDAAYWYALNGNFREINRNNQNSVGGLTTQKYTYTANKNQLAEVAWDEPIAGISTSTYIYDVIGNLTSDGRSGVAAIAYNQFHNLPTKMSKQNGDEFSYRYDVSGNRSVKVLNATDTEYYLEGIVVDQNDKPKQYSITEGFATLDVTNALHKNYNITDWLGNVRLVMDATGNIENVRDHFPYGKLMDGRSFSSNTEGARYQFTGHEFDGETMFGYHGARYYNKELGRYMSMDPLQMTYTAYTPYNYTLDNPINFIDPTGLAAEWIGEVDDEGQTNYIAEKGDTKETFASQYGLSSEQAGLITGNQTIKEGSVVSGQNVFDVTGSEVLKLDLSSEQSTSQRVFDHFLFSRDHASSKGSYAIPSNKYFSNRLSASNSSLGGVGGLSGKANLSVGSNKSIGVGFNLPLYRVSFDGSGNASALGTDPTSDKQTSGRQFENQLNTMFPFFHPKTGNQIGSYIISTTTNNGSILQNRFNRMIPRHDYIKSPSKINSSND